MRYEVTYALERELESDGEDTEWKYYNLDMLVEYDFGAPEAPPSYSHGGLPADPDEVHIISVREEGKPFILTEAEVEEISTWLLENPPEDDSDY